MMPGSVRNDLRKRRSQPMNGPVTGWEADLGFPPGEVFRAALDAVVVMDAGGRVRAWNPAAEALFGYTQEEALDAEVADLIVPGPLRSAHRRGLARYLESGQERMLGRRLEVSGVGRDGSEFPVELSISRLGHVEPPLFVGFLRALADWETTGRESLRLQKRLSFLAEAGLALDRSLDYDETLRALARLTVPDLAYLTAIDLLDPRGRLIEMTVAACQDDARARAVEEVRHENRLTIGDRHPVAEVLRSGRSALLTSMSSTYLSEIAQSAEHLALMTDMGYGSAVVVPLVARSQTLGTLSMLRMDGQPPFGEDDLVLAEELARRAALAVDNSRLFGSVRHLARTLQQSLLPEALPQIPGLQLAARYRASERGQDVGGDFYDVFAIDDGRWSITVGDVSGKGAEAAALTALARYTIRAIAGGRPSTVMRRLNATLFRDPAVIGDRFLTALFAVARVEGESVQLEIAGGGHPRPLLARAQGSATALSVIGPMLGMSRDAEFPALRVRLDPGDKLLLYTDGLTDAQAPERILTEPDLVRLLAEARPLHGADLLAALESRATGGRPPRDDIALLLLEVMAQAR